MWLILAFTSATLLGFYDVFKKLSLRNNAVIPVLLLNCIFSSLFFLPFILLSAYSNTLDGTIVHVATGGWYEHKYIILKSFIVLSSWLCGYAALKHLPITICGPINATRPMMVLLGATLLFSEHLNIWQWMALIITIISIYLLSRSGKKEGIRFTHNRWIVFSALAAILGAISGLYDKYLMASTENGGVGLDKMLVQGWFNIYQSVIMLIIFLVSCRISKLSPLQGWKNRWRWTILGISLFICLADFAYFFSLSQEGAMISVVSMIRRGSVIVSFLFGALIFREKNLKAKAFDVFLLLISMLLLYFGSK